MQKLLKPGEVLIVIDDKGERTTGALSGVSLSTLTLQVSIEGRGWLRPERAAPPEQRQFALGSVIRIDRRDSLKEGAWLGFAAGVGFIFATASLCGHGLNCSSPLSVIGYTTLGGLIGGPVIGALVDHALTTPIYRAPTGGRTAALGLSPALRRAGGVISVRFTF